MLSPNMILTSKVNQGTGKKHFLIEVGSGEDYGDYKKKIFKKYLQEKSSGEIFKSAYVPVRTFIHSHY